VNIRRLAQAKIDGLAANSVLSNRQPRAATKVFIKAK
jgi:hypothetical protein